VQTNSLMGAPLFRVAFAPPKPAAYARRTTHERGFSRRFLSRGELQLLRQGTTITSHTSHQPPADISTMTGTKRRTAAATALAVAMSCPGTMAFSPSTQRVGLNNIVARRGAPSQFTAGGRSADFHLIASQHQRQQPTTAAAMPMAAAPVVSAGAGAIAGCLTGGLFAGGLHAIAGKFQVSGTYRDRTKWKQLLESDFYVGIGIVLREARRFCKNVSFPPQTMCDDVHGKAGGCRARETQTFLPY